MYDTMITVENFRKTYGDFTAVDGISFAVPRGEIFGLLGPNGAGKTSTLECLEGLRQPDGGRMVVAGVDPSREARKLRGKIGVQLQTSGLPDTISAAEAMKFFCTYHSIKPRHDLIERLGLAEKRNTAYAELSTGQKRRLALALAVAHEPEVLFLDEPTAGLDVGSRVELHSLLRELQAQDTTILLATHDMAEAEALAGRVAILLHGQIAATGTPLEITAAGSGLTKVSVNTEKRSLEQANGSFPGVQQHLLKEDYVVYFSSDVGPTVSALIGYIESHGDALIDLRVERPSLEDRFLEITDGGRARSGDRPER
jgi:ABC-2 type transport system ATP-binding protein